MAFSETDKQKAFREMRKRAKALVGAQNYPRAAYVAGIGGMDAWFESNRAAIKTAIDNAAGVTFPNDVAKAIGKYWMLHKWEFE